MQQRLDPAKPACSLRAAIQLVTARARAQKITFDIPGSGAPIIAPKTALPPITTPVTLDATTQPGGWVELSGASAGSVAGSR